MAKKNTEIATRHLVLSDNQLAASSINELNGYIQSYSANISGSLRFAKDCAQIEGGVVVAEHPHGTEKYSIVADYRRSR